MDEFVRRLKKAPCMDCGQSYDPVCMDFDHRPEEAKREKVSSLRGYCLDTVMTEIAKCDLVCSNCHRIRTHRLRPPPPRRGKRETT